MKRISISDADFEQLAASDTRARPPWRLASVSYDRRRNRIVMGLANGVELSMPVSLVGELSAATADGLAQIHLSPSGEMVVVEQIDAHIGTKGLIETALSVIPMRQSQTVRRQAKGALKRDIRADPENRMEASAP